MTTTADKPDTAEARNAEAHAVQPSYILYTDTTFAIADTWVTGPLPSKNRGRNQQAANLIFLSISAAQHAIKAMRPPLRNGRLKFAYLQGLTAESIQPTPNGAVNPVGLRQGSFYETRLPKQPGEPVTSHLIAIAKHPGSINKKSGDYSYTATGVYVFAKSADDVPAAFYRHFKEHSTIPTIPEWAPHIWDFLRDKSLARKLPSSPNIHAWRCEIDDYILTPVVTAAVREGRLPIPLP